MSSEFHHTVFVYGALRQGASNSFRMAGGIFAGSASVRGRLYRISWYPGLVLDDEADRVSGELFQVSDELLAELDVFEGLPVGELEGKEYRRVKVQALRSDGETQEAWIYAWKTDVSDATLIPGGDWLKAQPD